MSLATEFFPRLSGGEAGGTRLVKDATGIVGVATRAVTGPAEKKVKHLFRRNRETGAPEGALAVMKDQLFRMLVRRVRKIGSRYGRRLT